jgi:hypothetical protein
VKGALQFRLTGWCAWSADRESPEQWLDWAKARQDGDRPAAAGYPLAPVPAMTRRRATALGQKGLSAAMALPAADSARLVLASRHGEFTRTLAILDMLARREPPSPTDFSMSVHNALAGLMSIATKNTRGHTAVSAGPASFCCGMLEAAAGLGERPDEPVILLYVDEPPGGGFADLLRDEPAPAPVVVALGMAAPESEAGEAISMTAQPQPGEPGEDGPALGFLRFLLSGEREAVAADRDRTWMWRRG